MACHMAHIHSVKPLNELLLLTVLPLRLASAASGRRLLKHVPPGPYQGVPRSATSSCATIY